MIEDRLNLDKTSPALKNLSDRTAYKQIQKMMKAAPKGKPFGASFIPDADQRKEREARERALEIARLRTEESECLRMALEADKAGNFKRYARFWNRFDAARQSLIRLGAVGPGA